MKRIYQNTMCLLLAGTLAMFPTYSTYALSQDETVYTKLQSDGSTSYISVNEHLVNDLKETELFDETILSDLENLNGFETYTTDGEKITWAANGQDIYYNGKTDKELPISLDITYKLDGEEKQVEEMLGKSGHVEIAMRFTNKSKVDDLYTPFVAAVATTLDEAKVSSVKVTNGKATGNGRSVAVAAVAAPGLYESLNLAELEHTDEIVLTFETEDFELNDIYIVVTPKLLDSADLKTFTELDELYAKTNTLSESSKQLTVGTTSLRNGLRELRNAVAGAKQKLQVPETMLDDATLNAIKAQASAAAEAKIAAQYDLIAASVKQQVEAPDSILAQSLKLQAQSMCEAASGDCSEAMVNQYYAQLVVGVEKQLVASSYELAKTTASQTAAATAETVALQIVKSLQSSLGQAIVGAFDSVLTGIDQLLNGAETLQAGMTQFNDEGIQPLVNFVNGKVRVTTDKVERLTKLADEYDNFAGLADGAKGTTKFIMMVDRKRRS